MKSCSGIKRCPKAEKILYSAAVVLTAATIVLGLIFFKRLQGIASEDPRVAPAVLLGRPVRANERHATTEPNICSSSICMN